MMPNVIAISSVDRSNSLDSLSKKRRWTDGRCVDWHQELCLLFIAIFLKSLGITLTLLGVYFFVPDLFILGPALLVVGAIVLMICLYKFARKAKSRAKVSGAKDNAFADLRDHHNPPEVYNKNRVHETGQVQFGLVAHEHPPLDDLYASQPKAKQSILGNSTTSSSHLIGKQASNVDATSQSLVNSPVVAFPNNRDVHPKDLNQSLESSPVEATFFTPLGRNMASSRGSICESEDLVPKLEERQSTSLSNASRTSRPSSRDIVNTTSIVPAPASYTPISLTTVDFTEQSNQNSKPS